ncbi:Vasculin [Myotis brandtii]|uniref:Vasculin n=1 Tax=Myotis brandtii TaxID=109478 RepID=S7NDY1_MYOBR|nr:Vasculin [Myotis brandtii]
MTAPAWLNFPTPSSLTKSSLNCETHSDNSWKKNSYDVNRQRHNSSDGFNSGIGRPNGGNFGRKEKNEWRTHGRNGTENINHQGIIWSSTFPQTDVLSSSLEAEHRLFKEMSWQENSENNETCAPLTENEMREFQVIREQLQKNDLRKNGILKSGLICDFKVEPWKNSTFHPMVENNDTETSSSSSSSHTSKDNDEDV